MLQQTARYASPQPIRIPPEPGHRTQGRGGTTRIVSSTLLGGVVVLVLVAMAGMILGAWRFTVIDTGSMRPTLNPGDVAVLTSEPLTDLQKGQIVAFHPPGEPSLTVIHRVFSIHRDRSGVVIQTKGDANNAVDPWRARLIDATVWREARKMPKVGYLAVWSQQRPVRLGVLIAIVILAVVMMLGWIWRSPPR